MNDALEWDGLPIGQIIVAVLVLVAFAFLVTRPDFRRRFAATPPIRRISLLGLALLTCAIVARVGGLI